MMATPFVGPSAFQVGSFFVDQYYYILQRQPDLVYQFYTDASTMVRTDGERNEVASAMRQIHSLVMSLGFTGIEIETTHALHSWSGGILVTVTGYVQAANFHGRRKFLETFFLAPQEKGYFVLNDVFHFLEEDKASQHPASILANRSFDAQLNTAAPPQKLDYMLRGEIQVREFAASPHVEENDTVDNYSITEPQIPEPDNRAAQDNSLEDSCGTYQVAENSMRDASSMTVQDSVGEVPKQTYASILRVPKIQQSMSPQASINKSAAPSTADWHVPQPPHQPSTSRSITDDKPGVGATEDSLAPEEEGEGRSVYVRNLPSTVSASDLEQEFKNFGRIRAEGVVIRNRKDIGVCYAFVEFEDLLGAQNAVKASPIQFGGRQVHIEERRANGNAPRGARRGRGRGRFQAEGMRGRFGGRSFGRGNGQDSNGRDYSDRLRDQQRLRRQDRGILGSHASRNGPSISEDSA